MIPSREAVAMDRPQHTLAGEGNFEDVASGRGTLVPSPR
jgi:hypothetical protein